MINKGLIFLLLFLCIPGVVRAVVSDTTKPEIIAVKTAGSVNITGKLDDPAWLQAIPVSLLYEAQPGENIPAGQKTEAMILYNKEFLYVGFRCYDTLPGLMRANLSDRDKIFTDDFVFISIDTYNNHQRGYEFAVNPFGIQGDLLMMGVSNEDPSYDMVWHSAASRNSSGWTAEMAIPFKSLSFSSDEVQKWTISIMRNMPRQNRYLLSWTPIDRNNPSFLAQAGYLTGLEGISSGSSLEFLPYMMIGKSGSKSDPELPGSPMDHEKVTARIGGGIQYSPSPAISLNAVINPDFSQIESDADQLSVNTTFALYYPEKRPFFMSGMDLIQTPMYYSRTINNPLLALKVNGKKSDFSYLALGALDRNTAITVPGEEESNTVRTDKDSYVSVGRLRYDLGNENFIGLLWLSRNFMDAHNYLNGLDWNFKFWKNWYFQGELFLSNTKEINDTALFSSTRQFGSTGHDAAFNGESYAGTGMHLSLIRQGRNYSFNLTQNNFSPTYQTYNGMFPEVGERTTYMNHSYTIQPNKKLLKSATLSTGFTSIFNYEGLLKDFSFQPGISFNLIGQTNISLSYLAINRERFRNVFFTGMNRIVFNAGSTPVKGVSFSISGQAGKYIYHYDIPEKGRGYDLSSSLDLEPMQRLKTSFSWTIAKLDNLNDGSGFYKGHIFRNITTFQFTRQLFMRDIVQYNTFSRAFSIYPLITYKFNAFTMFCAGMTRDLLSYEHDDYTFRTSGYQYFIKLQYLFSK